MLFGFSLMQQLRIGFFSGDPTRIAEDCSILRPHFFPSVPRLYNKIYSRIKGQFDAATGCKRWLVNRGLASK
jgi:long-chain acyl-CoA synthetase